MPLDIADGYTLNAETKGVHKMGQTVYEHLPIVEFSYRPALPDAINTYDLEFMRANSGFDRTTAGAKLIAEHVTAWNIVRRGNAVPIKLETARAIPMPIMDQIIGIILTWAPANQEKAAGNS